MSIRGAFGGLAIGLCLLLAACQGKSDRSASAEAEAPKTPPPPAVATAPATTATAARPEGADGVDEALAKVKAWNEQAVLQIKAVGDHEAKIHAAAARAIEAARDAESAPAARRSALTGQVTAARKAADAARALVVDGQAKARREADEQVTASAAMLEACSGNETLMAYEGCKALEAEHTILISNIEALSARYEKAEAAYGPDRAKLEEASAAVALAALR